jgi:hypothetical protein
LTRQIQQKAWDWDAEHPEIRKQLNDQTVKNIEHYLEMKRKLLLVASLWLLACVPCFAATNSVVATFDASVSTFVASNAIAYGKASRGTNQAFVYPTNLVFSKTNLSVTVSNLGPGLWFFSAYAISTNNIRSDYSNEASWTNKSFGPQNLRITGPVDALALQSSGDLSTWKTLAVITSTSAPLVVAVQPRSLFRVMNTNLPPVPR